METVDGFRLVEGDACYVSVQDPNGSKRLSFKPRKAIYRSKYAKQMGYDFEIPSLRTDGEVEVCIVWKNRPA